MADSKIEIYNLIPQRYYPNTILIKRGSQINDVLKKTEAAAIAYPLIAKPDIGLRGSAVKKIHSPDELRNYNIKSDFDYLIQELIPYPNEVGIFYVRYPHEKQGRLTGIVAKEFLVITGDGISSMAELIVKNPRHALQMESLKREYGSRILEILPLGQKANLVPYGNHARGAKFIDDSHKISESLTQTINKICLQIPGFYFGRLDVMYNTFDELERGENFLLVEVNGAGSEPTHIYDPKHSIFFAWKELFRHITYMYEISAENHKNGIPYLTYTDGLKEYKIHLEQNRKIVNF